MNELSFRTPLASRTLARILAIAAVLLIASGAPASAQFNRLSIFSPFGGETLVVGTTWNIRWYTPANITKLLKVEYSIDSGATWRLIDTTTARSGMDTLPWLVPNDTTRRGMVRVSTFDDSSTAKSRVFTISATAPTTLRVTYPNGGERFRLDSTIKIRWTASSVSGTLDVELSRDSGATWSALATGLPARNGSDSLTWRVAGDTSARCFVRVSIPGTPLTDRSDRVFTIRPNVPEPRITVQYPNGFERFVVDSVVSARWTGADLTGTLEIEYSADSGATWKPITSVPARNGNDTLRWTVPNDTTTRALFRVRSASLGVSDRSNWTFTIASTQLRPRITVLFPNGGESLPPSSDVVVRWSGSDLTGQVRAEYSLDAGATWSTIGQHAARNGTDSLIWRTPDTTVTTALVRVLQGTAAADTSDATFSIVGAPVPSISVLGPMRNTRIVTDTTIVVRWRTVALVGRTLTISASIDSGKTFTFVAERTVTEDGIDSIPWTAPSAVMDSVYIRIAADQVTVGVAGPLRIRQRATNAVDDVGAMVSGLSVQPNPVRDRVEFRWSGPSTALLSLVASDGAAILRAPIESGAAVDVGAVPPGVYVAVVRIGGSTMTRRLVIVR